MIKYTIQFKMSDEGREYWQDPVGYLYSSEDFARLEAKKHIDRRRKTIDSLSEKARKGWVEIIDYKILEVPVEDKVIIEGTVNEHGEYEDYEVCVGDKNIRGFIAQYYRGNKIKVTIELIE